MAEHHRGKTVTKPFRLKLLELPLSEKQIPQVVEKFESGGKPKEALETVELRPRQVRYQAALRPDILCFSDFKPLPIFPILSYQGPQTMGSPYGTPAGCGAGCLCLHSAFGHCHTGPAFSHFSTMYGLPHSGHFSGTGLPQATKLQSG